MARNHEEDAEKVDASADDEDGLDTDAVDGMLAAAADAHEFIEACIRVYGTETMNQVTEAVWKEVIYSGEVEVEDVVDEEPPDMLCDAIRLLGSYLQDPTGASSNRGKCDENWYEGQE